ncbi:MAG: metallophosphoesterase [Clostridia bacterium]|nr:metallophosphoesterase [Clostridia bacterium]
MLKIFHTADVHLDAPFSLSDPLEAEKRRTGLRSTFCSMIHAARRMEADVFLISGDLFEDSFATKDTAATVLREIESFPDCQFFIIPGNHDPYSENSPYALLSWPENVHIFTEQSPSYFELPEKNARIYGHAYTSKEIPDGLFSGFHVEDESKINILLAHGFVNIPQSSCNVLMKGDIENSGFDYIALGHVHTHEGFLKAGKTVYAYSGCAVGRSFDECGYKYAVAGSISKEGTEAKTDLSLYKCCDRRFEILNVDISGSRDNREALEKIKNAAAEYGEDTSLRIVMQGEVSPEVSLTDDDVRRVLRVPSYVETVDNTVPMFDAENLENDMTIVGAFYRRLSSALMSQDPAERKKAAAALKYGLAALCGRDING